MLTQPPHPSPSPITLTPITLTPTILTHGPHPLPIALICTLPSPSCSASLDPLSHRASRLLAHSAAFGGAEHAVEGALSEVFDGVGEGAQSVANLEGSMEREVDFAVREVGDLASEYGPSVLALVGMAYGLVIVIVVLCEAGRCVLGKSAFGAPEDDEERSEADSLIEASRAGGSRDGAAAGDQGVQLLAGNGGAAQTRDRGVGSVVSAML